MSIVDSYLASLIHSRVPTGALRSSDQNLLQIRFIGLTRNITYTFVVALVHWVSQLLFVRF